MTIAIVPTKFRVPAKGEVTINQLLVTVSSYSLGQSAQAYYDLQNKTTVTKSREVANPNYVPASIDADGNAVPSVGLPTMTEPYTEEVTTSFGLNGNSSLTQAQFDGWGNDDTYFANCIAENLGLTPA